MITPYSNIFPTLRQLVELDIEEELLAGFKEFPYLACYAYFHNENFNVSFALWRNEYGRCYEIGLRDLKTDNFELHFQGNFRACHTRFIRLAKLIEANRNVSKYFRRY